MPTTYTIDFAFFPDTNGWAVNGTRDQPGSTLSWSSTNSTDYTGLSPQNTVFDNNDDGLLQDDGSDFWTNSNFPFSGYTITINGVAYPVFETSTGFPVILRPVGETWTSADIPNATNAYSGNNFDLTNFCFVGGTGIATPTGEVSVESLSIGDPILTADGKTVPVLWVGRQKILNRLWMAEDRMPVCIEAGVLGNHTALYVSADHAMLVDDLMINAGALVNHQTIRFANTDELPDEFTYYHIETEAHDIILANGAPSETFVDAITRSHFDNYDENLALYGAERIIMEMNRPRITTSRLVPDDIKARLAGDQDQITQAVSAA